MCFVGAAEGGGALVERDLATIPNEVEGPVPHRCEKPGPGAHQIASALEVAVRLEEHLLHDVLRVRPPTREMKGITKCLSRMLLVEHREDTARARANRWLCQRHPAAPSQRELAGIPCARALSAFSGAD